jgi:hypothetical protein
MKSQLLAVGCTLSLLLMAGVANAQADLSANPQGIAAGRCSDASANEVIAAGPPALTLQATDCALDFIAFTASEVRGGKHMLVDPAMRKNWRIYLAMQYGALAPQDRAWFASAPDVMAAVSANFSHLPWLSRVAVRQQWAAALPGMLQFIAPVVMASQEGAPKQSMAKQLGDMIRQQQWAAMIQQLQQQQQPQQNAATAQDLQVQKDLFNNSARAITLQKGMINSTNDTINLMHAYSGH